MSMQKVSVLVPPLRATPRGAVWVGVVLDWALPALARDRAALVALARRYEASQPEFAKDLHAAACVDRDI